MLLKAKLFRYLKPWQKDKAVHLRFHQGKKTVQIYRCPVPKNDPRETPKTSEGEDDEDGEKGGGASEAAGGVTGGGVNADGEFQAGVETCAVEGTCAEDAERSRVCKHDVTADADCDLVWEGELEKQ
jgi:hypothetical protein